MTIHRLLLPQAAQEAGFYFRVWPGNPVRLAEEIDGQRGFAELLKTRRAAALEVFAKLRAVLAVEGTEQVQFVDFV